MSITRDFYDYPPALGWQTVPFVVSGSDKLLDQSEDNNILYGNASDYYMRIIQQVNPESDHQISFSRINKKIQVSNSNNLFGYIPVIGTLVGAKRIISTIKDKHLPIKNKVAHILRGSVEFLSLGFLLIIPDIILSNCRNFHSKLWPATNLSSFSSPSSSPRGSENVQTLDVDS